MSENRQDNISFMGLPECVGQDEITELAPSLKYQHTNYILGHVGEKIVIEYLQHFCKLRNCRVIKSSPREDILHDIDCFLVIDGLTLGVSIKTQPKALETGNLMFELEAYEQREGEKHGEWKDSWFRTGKPDVYLFLVGENLYWIPRTELLKYLKRYNFDDFRKSTKETKKRQQASGHPHKNMLGGRIRIERLIQTKTAEVLEKRFSQRLSKWRGSNAN